MLARRVGGQEWQARARPAEDRLQPPGTRVAAECVCVALAHHEAVGQHGDPAVEAERPHHRRDVARAPAHHDLVAAHARDALGGGGAQPRQRGRHPEHGRLDEHEVHRRGHDEEQRAVGEGARGPAEPGGVGQRRARAAEEGAVGQEAYDALFPVVPRHDGVAAHEDGAEGRELGLAGAAAAQRAQVRTLRVEEAELGAAAIGDHEAAVGEPRAAAHAGEVAGRITRHAPDFHFGARRDAPRRVPAPGRRGRFHDAHARAVARRRRGQRGVGAPARHGADERDGDGAPHARAFRTASR
jgi:hypothetical protein